MKSKENLVFLGMMGSGKSSIGSIVSKKLNIDFIDIDQEIEKLTAYLERGQAVLDSHRAEAQQKASPVKDTPFSSIAGGP